MKKVLFSIVAVLALAVSLVSCNSNSPKASAEKFLNGLNHMDYESAKSVSTEETKKMLDMMSQLTAMLPDSSKETAKKVQVKIGEEKVNGDKATVSYTTSEDTTAKQLTLVKEKGKWLVQWTKNENPAGNPADSNTPQTGDQVPANDTAAVPVEPATPGNDTAVMKK
ncbi:hypothetical protein ACTHGU_13060 [Chitinophagaceae bacterium MMS25-I14]